jgi:hypothetical protein
VKQRNDWRPPFDHHNRWIAVAVSRTIGCWEILVGGRSMGTVANPAAAEQLIERVNDGGEKS